MPKRKIDEVDADDESQAEAELVVAIAAAANAPADESFAGLGPSKGPVVFRVKPEGPPPPQYKPGAAPGEKPLVFFYFALKGLGEVQRLLLAEAGVTYDHVVVFFGEEQAAVANWRARSPNGLLPMLSGLGIPRSTPLSQSPTQVRYLARRFGLAGQTELEGLAADVMYETAKDLDKHKDVIAAMPAKGDKDDAAKGPWATALRLEKMLAIAPAAEDDSAAITYGQLQLFFTLENCEARAPGCVKSMSEALEKFRSAMAARPRLAAYLGSKMCFPWTNGELGKEGGYTYVSGPLVRKDLKL